MDLLSRRAVERQRYERAYLHDEYRMSMDRLRGVVATLLRPPVSGFVRVRRDTFRSILDVGCGRGDLLDVVKALGWQRVQGTEVVSYLVEARDDVCYADAWDLPFAGNEFDTVVMVDVLEHLVGKDSERTCRELARVAGTRVVLTVHNSKSKWKDMGELHINRRPYEVWDELFRDWFGDWGAVEWLRDAESGGSETWEARRHDV